MWVKSEALSPEAILAALKRGDYYSSTGPMIHDLVVTPGESVTIRCSPAERIFVTGKGPRSVYKYGSGLIEAELDIRKFDSPYCRVTVRDRNGGRAWSNPIWLNE